MVDKEVIAILDRLKAKTSKEEAHCGNGGNNKDGSPESPRPLMREIPPADPFPTDALGEILANAAVGIQDRTQAPLAMCGQSVLATATLATQGHASVHLPTGQLRPISNYFATIGVTGERKSAVDTEATWPVRKREAALREQYGPQKLDYENSKEAWDKARDHAKTAGKGDKAAAIKAALERLGSPPDEPLLPRLTCSEPTIEGLVKVFAKGGPSLGIFSDEGGMFIGGHGLTPEAKLRTASTLSKLWDGSPIDRVRGGDGATILPARRLAMHLMVQPNVAALFLGDGMLAEQGLLSRVLATAPESHIGRRMWRAASADADAAMRAYGARLLDIFELPLPLAEGKRNELAPRELKLSRAAHAQWIAFHDYVECNLREVGGKLWPVRGFGNKLPEHAVRLAAVVTLVADINAPEIDDDNMRRGIELAEHYAIEALRLFEASKANADLALAQRLLDWLHRQWPEEAISLPDIYQRSLNAIGDQATARKLVNILVEHGWLEPIPGGAIIVGCRRREAWRIVRGS
jgi:Protein of unknown function (DUF3987)